MSTNTSAPRWWLALDGRPDGPRTTAYITAALQTGAVTLTTPVCPEGDCRWQPLAAWPELAEIVRTTPSAKPPPAPVARPAGVLSPAVDDRLLTNPLLPAMANLICVYAIVVAPLYWIFGVVSTLLTGDNPFLHGTGPYTAYVLLELLDTVVVLGIVVLGVIAGISLRKLDRSAPRLLLIVLSCRLTWCAVYVIGGIALLLVGISQDVLDDSEISTGATVFSFLYLLFALALTALEIVALVWLIRCRRNLPLY